MTGPIDKLAWLHIKDRKVLVARSRGKTLFYLPGGKRDTGETDTEALTREIREELGVALDTNSLRLANIFTAQADAKPPGTMVRIAAYFAGYDGVLSAASEIEEIDWADSRDAPRCSITGRLVLVWLKDQGLID